MQQEEEGNDRQDIHQRAEGLASLRQLGQRGAVGSETGQLEVSHGELMPLEPHDAINATYHGWAAGEADLPGATSSAKQPSALAWALAVVERCRLGCTGALLHGECAEGAGRGSAAVGRLIGGQEALWVAECQRL